MKLASIGGGIAVSSAIWGWMGLNYQPMALMVGGIGVCMSATGVLVQIRRHRSLSREEDRRFELYKAIAEREEQRKIAEHSSRMAALQAKAQDPASGAAQTERIPAQQPDSSEG